VRPDFGPLVFSSLTLAHRMILPGAFSPGERGPHPRAGFNRRRGDATGVVERQPSCAYRSPCRQALATSVKPRRLRASASSLLCVQSNLEQE
jgi:hypothetical protein